MSKRNKSEIQQSEDYKMTELCPLPEEWQVVRLGEVTVLTMGQSPPSSTYNTAGQGFPFLQGKAEFGTIYPVPLKWCSQPQRIAERGSVLISVRAPVGDVNIADRVYCIGRGLAAITGTDNLDNWFLFYQLIFSKQRLEEKGTGSTFKSISKGVLQNFPIPLPPLPEQRAIAYVLRTVQRAKEATERVIAALKELKKSLMKHLFTYGSVPLDQADQVALQDTPIGPIPAHWRLIKLGEVAEKPQYGYTSSAVHDPVGPKFLRITDIQNDRVQWASVPYCVIEDDLLHKYRLRRGDILFARIGATTGKTYLISECPQAVFASYLIRIRTNASQLLPEYLYFFTHTPQYWQQINAAKGGRLKQGINIPILTTLNVPLPPLDEQREIARILQTVNRKIEAEENRKRALEGLFKTLLHHLMTAKVRMPREVVEQFEGPGETHAGEEGL